jgi:hypothetical protein
MIAVSLSLALAVVGWDVSRATGGAVPLAVAVAVTVRSGRRQPRHGRLAVLALALGHGLLALGLVGVRFRGAAGVARGAVAVAVIAFAVTVTVSFTVTVAVARMRVRMGVGVASGWSKVEAAFATGAIAITGGEAGLLRVALLEASEVLVKGRAARLLAFDGLVLVGGFDALAHVVPG